MKITHFRKASVCFVAIAAAVLVSVLQRNEVFLGVCGIILRKWNEKILPTQSVEWLKNYKLKEKIWQNLKVTEEFSGERPNILLIVADDLGMNDISGGAGVLTPHMDSIAKNGLNFTQAYAAQSTCAPSRAALFTGRYPTNIGFEFTPVPKFLARFLARKLSNVNSPQPVYNEHLFNEVPDMMECAMPKDVPTVPELLSQCGYHNFLIGKWDGGFVNDSLPIGRGFDESLSMESGGSLYAKANDPRIVNANNISFDSLLKRVLSFKIRHNNGPFFEPDEYLTDYLGLQTVKLIERLGETKTEFTKGKERKSKDDPWFITVTFTAPHNPFQALKSDFDKEEIQKIPTQIGKIYGSMIHALDRNVGKILESLKASHQYENTLIIFTSDNGAAPYVGLPNLNAPYRGWKGTLFEGGVHVPFFLQWPKEIKNINKKVNDIIMQIDILPTIYSLATKGIEFISNVTLKEMVSDGRNLLDSYFASSISGENSSFTQNRTQEISSSRNLRKGEKRTLFWRSGNYKALRFGDYKLQIHLNPNKIWFYNLKIDRSERNNLMGFLNPEVPADESHRYPSIFNSHQLDEYILHRQRNTTFYHVEDDEVPFHHISVVSGAVLTSKVIKVPQKTTLLDTDDVPSLLPREEISSVYHRHNSEIVGVSDERFYTRDIILSNLIHCYEKLQEIDRSQRRPLWPALTEVPVCIDKPAVSSNNCLLTDEYIVWPN
jgi:arylsulfatase A-like enzyme